MSRMGLTRGGVGDLLKGAYPREIFVTTADWITTAKIIDADRKTQHSNRSSLEMNFASVTCAGQLCISMHV